VVVQVTDPRGSQTSVVLDATGSGTFTGSLSTTLPGVYSCRFLATGRTAQGQIFIREETRTISAFVDRIPDGSGSDEDDKRGGRGDPPMDVAELLRGDRAVSAASYKLLSRTTRWPSELVWTASARRCTSSATAEINSSRPGSLGRSITMEPTNDRDRMKEELKQEIMGSLQPVELSRLGLLSSRKTPRKLKRFPALPSMVRTRMRMVVQTCMSTCSPSRCSAVTSPARSSRSIWRQSRATPATTAQPATMTAAVVVLAMAAIRTTTANGLRDRVARAENRYTEVGLTRPDLTCILGCERAV
jgi:hypothetical protein